MLKICKNCGAEFEAEHNRQMYCCNDCLRISRNRAELRRRRKTNIQNIKLCAWCGKPLENIRYKHQKYCSDKCIKAASKERRQSRRPLKRKHLCWTCQNYVNGCSWSKNGVPVPGWTATQTPRIYRGKEIGINYRVHKCPRYLPDN